MGEQRVHLVTDQKEMQSFIRSLLDDVKALEFMLQSDWFESDIQRIGAEQEMVLVNVHDYKPAMVAQRVLEEMKDFAWLESELAQFNLEITLNPQIFKDNCLRKLEEETLEKLRVIRDHLKPHKAAPLLTGILPTLRKFDLSLANLTPKKRYKALMEAINAQRLGSNYDLRIEGIDELIIKHDSPMLEACNTSFQVHLQVTPAEFVKMYNIAQMLSAPVMAIAANSPLVFGRRLWHETRIAMFQQSIDTRSSHKHLRERLPRVNFGSDWLQHSILEIYKEDIARFRV
ncbi:MAG: glutamate-cysteine ligase family protein, partial [Saprospiraceae bacterium]|nr:glutamate-cysteine ligase family protein [Saprospiraceae bacterium]